MGTDTQQKVRGKPVWKIDMDLHNEWTDFIYWVLTIDPSNYHSARPTPNAKDFSYWLVLEIRKANLTQIKSLSPNTKSLFSEKF